MLYTAFHLPIPCHTQIDGWRFVLVSVHLKAAGWGGVDTAQLSVRLLVEFCEAASVNTSISKHVLKEGKKNRPCQDSNLESPDS